MFGFFWRSGVRFLLLCGVLALSAGTARPQDALCENGECQPVVSLVTYFGRAAIRLTDGKTEAVIVPQIGRIMRFAYVGGPNWLWNAPTPQGLDWGWKNYGGDKNWLAPQSEWPRFHGKSWPPDEAFDGQPFSYQVLSGGKLRLTSPLSKTGVRFERTFYFQGGELVIEQTARKEKGAPLRASIWNVAQAAPGEALFLPRRASSAYSDGYATLQGAAGAQKVEVVAPQLLRVVPQNAGGGWKIGADAPVAAIANVRDGVAWVQRATFSNGPFPDGKDGKPGFPVELYVTGNAKNFYCEMELLGPLKNFVAGSSSTHTLRWGLHALPSRDVYAPAVARAVGALLGAR